MNTVSSAAPPTRMPVFLPILIASGILSIASSLFVSNYWGMGIAVVTLILAACVLRDASRARGWVIGLATAGFVLGLIAMLMKIMVMKAQQ